jgi:hypothetical protein
MTVPRGASEVFGILGVACGMFNVDLANYPPPIVGGATASCGSGQPLRTTDRGDLHRGRATR